MKNNTTILVIILLVLNQIFKKFISKMDCYNYNWLLGSLSIIFGFLFYDTYLYKYKLKNNILWNDFLHFGSVIIFKQIILSLYQKKVSSTNIIFNTSLLMMIFGIYNFFIYLVKNEFNEKKYIDIFKISLTTIFIEFIDEIKYGYFDSITTIFTLLYGIPIYKIIYFN